MFALDFRYVCTHCISSLLGYNIVLLSNMVFVILLDFFFLSVCFCALRVFLPLPHLTIYSKVSFSAGLQGNDTEDYCLDQ